MRNENVIFCMFMGNDRKWETIIPMSEIDELDSEVWGQGEHGL